MTAITKKISIETESHEVFIVRANGKNELRAYCESCATQTEMLTLDEAVTSLAVFTRKILSLIDEGAVHSVEASSGHLLICQNSLRNHFNNQEQKGDEL